MGVAVNITGSPLYGYAGTAISVTSKDVFELVVEGVLVVVVGGGVVVVAEEVVVGVTDCADDAVCEGVVAGVVVVAFEGALFGNGRMFISSAPISTTAPTTRVAPKPFRRFLRDTFFASSDLLLLNDYSNPPELFHSLLYFRLSSGELRTLQFGFMQKSSHLPLAQETSRPYLLMNQTR